MTSAAGNGGESAELYYPAACEGVLAVGSHDKNLAVSDFTQRNGTVDLLAPGEDIWLPEAEKLTARKALLTPPAMSVRPLLLSGRRNLRERLRRFCRFCFLPLKVWTAG